jgi:transposase
MEEENPWQIIDKGDIAMDQNTLFAMALGLEEPWLVKEIRFSAKERRLDIHLDFPRGGGFSCPRCGKKSKAYDTTDKVWRHLNFFQHECFLHARIPRIDCGEGEGCGILQVEVPWARPQSSFTLLFEALLMALVQQMPVAAVAALVGESDQRLWRVLHHYVAKARNAVDMSCVKVVGIDETSSRKGHNYITCFVDLNKSQILFVAEGRGKNTVENFRDDLVRHHGQTDKVEHICCDLSPAYISGVEATFSEAALTFDRFHIMKIINNAVDTVRREESKDKPELRRTRYLWLKNEANLTVKQQAQFESVRNIRSKTARAYQLKVTFQEFFVQKDKTIAEIFLRKWYSWARRSRLEPMKAAAQTVRSHWNGVLNWYDSRISNGVLEGINSLIQAAKARARGYRSVRNLATMAYLIAGKLKFALPT